MKLRWLICEHWKSHLSNTEDLLFLQCYVHDIESINITSLEYSQLGYGMLFGDYESSKKFINAKKPDIMAQIRFMMKTLNLDDIVDIKNLIIIKYIEFERIYKMSGSKKIDEKGHIALIANMAKGHLKIALEFLEKDKNNKAYMNIAMKLYGSKFVWDNAGSELTKMGFKSDDFIQNDIEFNNESFGDRPFK